jgi:hypothetical protein
VEKHGENLPSGNNTSHYLDAKGRMDLLAFFKDHQQQFSNLFIVIQREIVRRVTEAGCERFFGQSGYVSQPRRSQLGVRNYERLALLGHIQNLLQRSIWRVASVELGRRRTPLNL